MILTKVEYSYFNTGPIIEETTGSYADRSKGGNIFPMDGTILSPRYLMHC